MTRNQFDLISKLIAGMAELADQVVPDVMGFASPGEARAVLADIEEIQDWFEALVVFSPVAGGT
jgi:hypothetical protein